MKNKQVSLKKDDHQVSSLLVSYGAVSVVFKREVTRLSWDGYDLYCP
jgi:hypothetical protein